MPKRVMSLTDSYSIFDGQPDGFAPPEALSIVDRRRVVHVIWITGDDRPQERPRPACAVGAGTNATGFTAFEYGMSGKWLELLKQIAPAVTRVAVIRDPEIASRAGQFGAIQSVAPSFAVELRPIGLRDNAEMERAITAFARPTNGGLIVTPSALTLVLRATIIALAARHKLPAIYPSQHFVAAGGLICYGPDLVEQYRQAASYIDRILKGEKPADLPVKHPPNLSWPSTSRPPRCWASTPTVAARPRRRGDRVKPKASRSADDARQYARERPHAESREATAQHEIT